MKKKNTHPSQGSDADEFEQMSLALPLYDQHFLDLHAGRVISDPEVAIVELVANAWDAGADTVKLEWPTSVGETLAIEDDGTGLTSEEFKRRWLTLHYNRTQDLGREVRFPVGSRKRTRVAFGRNGIGRHAMFHFADEYHVESKRDGHAFHLVVRRSSGSRPFEVDPIEKKHASGHGTRIWARAEHVPRSDEEVRDLIGSRFVADPAFQIHVNRTPVRLTDIEHLCTLLKANLPAGAIQIRRFDCESPGRTSKQNGVAWWVNGRLVGTPSWEVLGPHALLDARSSTAKRYTYIIDASMLEEHVKADWTGFRASALVNDVRAQLDDFIRDDLRALTADWRRERKKAVLQESKRALRELPRLSQEQVARFADELQVHCPNLNERDLANAVGLFAAMEKARTGYSLMEKLTQLAPDDVDGLNAILDDWSVSDAKKVLNELRYRLELIEHLERLVEKADSDELHELQPLFERGLWMFGPQFESVEFLSNRTLATVLREYFEGEEALATRNKRPDFVVLPDASLGIYAADQYDTTHSVCGIAHVVIIELKRGGIPIGIDQKSQAQTYAREIRRSGKVGRTTRIECFVLGTSIEAGDEDPLLDGSISVHPRGYAAVLRQAHSRTFNLLNKIEGLKHPVFADPDLEAVLDEPDQDEMFGKDHAPATGS